MRYSHIRFPASTISIAVLTFLLGLAACSNGIASTFYLLQLTNWPPVPFDPWPELPRWSLGNDIFVIDDSSVDYESMQENSLSPPEPGSGGTVTNSEPWAAYSYTGCGLWLEIAATTNSNVVLTCTTRHRGRIIRF